VLVLVLVKSIDGHSDFDYAVVYDVGDEQVMVMNVAVVVD
jgi:hypothetical protein